MEDSISKILNSGMNVYKNFQKYSYSLWILSLTLYSFFSSISLFVSGSLYILGLSSFGLIYLMYSYNNSLKAIFEILPYNLTVLQISKVSINKINSILLYNNKLSNCPQIELNKIQEIKTNSLNFYFEKEKILDDINISFHEKKTYFIFGDSGDGKSTFLKLITKELFLDNAEIYFNGTPINEIDNESFKKRILCLTNNTELFEDSLLFNLTLKRDFKISNEITEKLNQIKLLEKLELNNFNDFLNLDKITDEQKQLICLLRCFFIKKDLIILDEANSKISNDINQIIMSHIREENPSSIIIIVSHNLSKSLICDHILKIVKGRLEVIK